MHNLVGPDPNKAGFEKVEPGIIQIINQVSVFIVPLSLEVVPGSIKVI